MFLCSAAIIVNNKTVTEMFLFLSDTKHPDKHALYGLYRQHIEFNTNLKSITTTSNPFPSISCSSSGSFKESAVDQAPETFPKLRELFIHLQIENTAVDRCV